MLVYGRQNRILIGHSDHPENGRFTISRPQRVDRCNNQLDRPPGSWSNREKTVEIQIDNGDQ